MQDRAAGRCPLRHPRRQVPHQLVGAARQASGIQERGRALGAVAGKAMKPGVEAEVLGDRQVAIEQRLMAQETDAAPDAPASARQLVAEDSGLAGAWTQKSGQDAQERRLARAVGAQDAHSVSPVGSERLTSRRTDISPKSRPRPEEVRPRAPTPPRRPPRSDGVT